MYTRQQDQPIAQALGRLARGERLGAELTTRAFGQVMRGEATPVQMAALLMGLRVQRESGEEIAGAVRALRDAMVAVDVPVADDLIDTCGTGGGAVRTFNISTAAALVATAAGVRVAKHGNRSFTSRCGSADVLEALGIRLARDPQEAAAVLQAVGMTFLFAPAFHPAMRHVAPVRRELAVATIMNMVGPLANPARVVRQLVGVADAERGPLLADALARLGAQHALVVHGKIGMDEIAPTGETLVWEVRSGEVRAYAVSPEALGLTASDVSALAGGDPQTNATRIERLLADPGSDPAGRAAVGLNAGAALYVGGRAGDLAGGVAQAVQVLDSGQAAGVLARLRDVAPFSISG